MATITDDSKKKDAADFEAAYAEEQKKPEQSEDEAFGLTPDEAPGTATPTGAPTVVIAMDKGAEGSAAEEAGEISGQEADEQAAGSNADDQGGGAAPAVDVEKETQRLKSWEGRLKAQQAEIDRAKAEAAASGAGGTGDDDADGAKAGKGEGEGEDEDFNKAMEALEADFGPEFVQLLKTVVTGITKRCASEHAAPYRKDIDAIIAEITNEKQRNHYEKIADAHPDFMELAESADFKAWVAGMAEADKAETERIISSGTAKEIIAMLKRYKATQGNAGADMDHAMDQAEGVRSTGGLKLPESPAASGDYADAWDKF